MPFRRVITAPELHQHLESLNQSTVQAGEAQAVLVDLRSSEAYLQGHIAGAIHGDSILLNRSEPPAGGLLPKAESVNRFLELVGANPGDHIFAYDGGLETSAARLIWVLEAYGYPHGTWLSGGIRAWQHHKLPLTDVNSFAQSGSLSLTLAGDNVVSVEQTLELLNKSDVKILDVRSADEFSGKDVRATYGGHVPHAIHQEWHSWLDQHGQLLPSSILQKRLTELGIRQDDTVIVYCQTHQRSAVTYVALKYLGYQDVRAIDGAWSAWGSRADTPKQTEVDSIGA